MFDVHCIIMYWTVHSFSEWSLSNRNFSWRINKFFGHRIKCVKRPSLLCLQAITSISELILHNSLSLFCNKISLLLSEEKLRPTIPLSSCDALYEECEDFLHNTSCLLLWLFTHPVIANCLIRIKYEFWIKIIKPRFSFFIFAPYILIYVQFTHQQMPLFKLKKNTLKFTLKYT